MSVFGTAKCTVPGCGRSWSLDGGRQGFVKAAARSHALSHWYKWHLEQKHEAGDCQSCPKCKEAGFNYYRAALCTMHKD